ncbi:hypothetical protein D7S86_17555 [Pararobbsia silviterrae]|uniref:Uncharacterized protein n=1 Tax=Pararobbsia silviterrae TaxID=1792498 RepID=A0A494XM48_9BURK|nr:hypothetical protein D7S86_17555 [Pararobbsia silviterrae]
MHAPNDASNTLIEAVDTRTTFARHARSASDRHLLLWQFQIRGSNDRRAARWYVRCERCGRYRAGDCMKR